jgi:hypothetical protein
MADERPDVVDQGVGRASIAVTNNQLADGWRREPCDRDPIVVEVSQTVLNGPTEGASIDRQRVVQPPQTLSDRCDRRPRVIPPTGVNSRSPRKGGGHEPVSVAVGTGIEYPGHVDPLDGPSQPRGLGGQVKLLGRGWRPT